MSRTGNLKNRVAFPPALEERTVMASILDVPGDRPRGWKSVKSDDSGDGETVEDY